MKTSTTSIKIRQGFSKAAQRYDSLSAIHQTIGLRLLDQLPFSSGVTRILDIGMGTGWLAERLKQRFMQAQVVGCDFASGMIDQAKTRGDEYYTIQADAHDLPIKNDQFDLIISNVAFQWMRDLKKSFDQVHRVLKNNGELLMTTFGRETFQELFRALEMALKEKNKHYSLERLWSAEEIEKSLKESGFQSVSVEKELFRMHYTDLFELIQWIKAIGANYLRREFFVGKDILRKANEIYLRNYKEGQKIYATFELVWIKARKAS